MAQGSVKWYDKKKGYGFISSEEGSDVFVHYTSLTKEGSYLKEGDKVAFEIIEGEKGPQAAKVEIFRD